MFHDPRVSAKLSRNACMALVPAGCDQVQANQPRQENAVVSARLDAAVGILDVEDLSGGVNWASAPCV